MHHPITDELKGLYIYLTTVRVPKSHPEVFTMSVHQRTKKFLYGYHSASDLICKIILKDVLPLTGNP